MKFVYATLLSVGLTLILGFSGKSFAASNVYSIAYASVGVSSAAFTTVVASSPLYVTHLQVCDTSGSVIELAAGSSGHEVPLFTIPPSACGYYQLSPILAQGSRLSLKQILYSATTTSASVTSGYGTVSFLP